MSSSKHTNETAARKPLLLHACCGPCSLEPVRLLREEGFEPTILWANPNIQPPAEHDRRLLTLLGWAADADLEVIVVQADRERWERDCAPKAGSRPERCRSCYALRLDELCHAATEHGFKFVSTTLAVSPHQLWETCAEELVAAAAGRGLIPVVHDWRSHYNDAQEIAKERGMYRQNYCGCRFSAAESQIERQARRDARKRERAHATAELEPAS